MRADEILINEIVKREIEIFVLNMEREFAYCKDVKTFLTKNPDISPNAESDEWLKGMLCGTQSVLYYARGIANKLK